MPVSAAQVFGPTTVDPGFTTTGEKTLLSMATTLAAGGKNVILAVMYPDGSVNPVPQGTLRIYKGTTLLYETKITEYLSGGGNRASVKFLIAVDDAPAGNDTYYFKVNVTSTSTSSSVHVQGMVIKSDDAVWVYNTATTSVANGATATIVTANTAFPAGSKVAIIGVSSGSKGSGLGHVPISSGNVRIKSGTTIVSSNQFTNGSYSPAEPYWISLIYLDTPATSSQTYSIEIYNTSGTTLNVYGELVCFTVADGAFLDTASVALTSGSQVTVGNLSTTLSGDAVAVALAATENTGTAASTYQANDIVHQINNDAVTQVANALPYRIDATSAYKGRSGTMPLFRFDTAVTNPSYQVKMTARADGINGEAKILAFAVFAPVLVSVSDVGVGVDSVVVTASVGVSDAGSGSEVAGVKASIGVGDAGVGSELVGVSASVGVGDAGIGADTATAGQFISIGDSGIGGESLSMVKEVLEAGAGVELVDMKREVLESGVGVDTIWSPQFNPASDGGTAMDTMALLLKLLDSGGSSEMVNMTKEVLDSGTSVETVPFMVKETTENGVGVETVMVSASIYATDTGIGSDTIGLVVYVTSFDTGVGVESVETFLSIYGDILLDGVETIGKHSIPYRDLVRDGLPIQTQRRAVDDRVMLDSDEIGSVLVEWEDKVADIVSGVRTLRVAGVVKLVD